MGRPLAVAVAISVSLLAVSGAGGASAQTPKRGGTVVLNQFGDGPPCLNFLDSRCYAPLSSGPRGLVADTLLGAFQLRDGTFHPRLVSKVEFTTTPPYTLTYSIRPDARWSDGVPVSARDFVFTYLTFLRSQLLNPGDAHGTMIRSVEAVAPKSLRVVLRSRFAHWRELFDVVLPRHALAGVNLKDIWSDAIDDPKTGQPIASGPFFVTSYEIGRAGDRRLVTRRNPRYWGPHPAYLDQIHLWWSRLPQNELIDALRRGKIHRTDLFDPQLVAQARATRGLRLDVRLAGSWEHFELRLGTGGHPALQDRRVRRALAYGIDRSTIVRELFAHIDPKARPSDSAIYLAEDPAYEPNWRIYHYRPELARQLLVRGGCRLGADGIRVCEQGGRLSLRFVTRGDNPDRALTLRVVQAQLLRLGVLVEPVHTTQGALFGQILPSGDFDVALFGWGRTVAGMADFYGCGGVNNFTGYCDRGLTGELKEADRILDAGLRAELLNRADVQLAADVPVVPLFQPRIGAATAATFQLTRSRGREDWWLGD